MKNTLRILSVAFAIVLCVGLMAACGGNGETKPTDEAKGAETVGTTAPVGTEPFVAPADSIGKIVAADSTLITWNTYATDDETIDFMGVNIKALGDPSEEMTLFYLEADVTYYMISEGKLVDATIEDVVPGSVIGITTLEEGVQEVYIVYVPVEDDGSDDYEDVIEEVVEATVADTTAATEEATPEESVSDSTDPVYEGTPEDNSGNG